MRDQILTGIRNAIRATGPYTHPHLSDLSLDETEALADHILAALAEVPADTPAPQATVIAADTPALMFSPADVVAMLAGAARNADLRDETVWNDAPENGDTSTPNVVVRTYPAPADYKTFRQFMFLIQAMFGVRVRFVRDSAGEPEWVVAGTLRGVEAFATTLDTFRVAALDYTTGVSEDEQATFWATLGSLVADNDRAHGIASDNEDAYNAATQTLREVLGPARTIRRVTPVADGPVYERASAVAADATARGL